MEPPSEIVMVMSAFGKNGVGLVMSKVKAFNQQNTVVAVKHSGGRIEALGLFSYHEQKGEPQIIN